MKRWTSWIAIAASTAAMGAHAQAAPKSGTAGKMAVVSSAEADRQARRLVAAMTTEEKLQLLRPLAATSFQMAPGANTFPEGTRKPPPPGAISSAGYVPPIPRLKWPALQESDGPIGVANMKSWIRGLDDQATAQPSSLAWAASFDPALAQAAGEVVGDEAHAKGFNVMLSGGINLAREPRNGRNFEYAGEDPLLAGEVIGASIAGMQSRNVVSTIKHYALNDQESGRGVLDARIAQGAARESDLLAFEIAIQRGRPGAVMCSYNKVNGDHACENDWLLNRVLKGDWGYRGWVMSDWGGVHDMRKAVASGLDQQSPQGEDLFAALPEAVAKGEIPMARINDMAFRIVRSLIAVGGLENPAKPGGRIDVARNVAVAQKQAEAGAVLLKNDGLLPLEGKPRIVVIGGYADVGVLLGGGGSMVNPHGGIVHQDNAVGMAALSKWSFAPSSPLKALRALRPDLEIVFDDGKDAARAAEAARKADIAIVFALKLATENFDVADLSLPNKQDDLIAAVAAANPKTAVVLETGNPVTMPWLGSVKAVLQAWYPGQKGGEAIAALLTGQVAPSGRLPITFPQSVEQLPRKTIDGYDPKASLFSPPPKPFAVDYHEGSDVGYRWYEREKQEPLFPFGYGLTYTRFEHTNLKIEGGADLKVSFTVTNVGKRAGVDVPQLYVAPPGRTHRLAGWSRVALAPGESRRVTISADPRILASYETNGWRRAAGDYDVRVSPSAKLSGLQGTARLKAAKR
ncbi:glycoside hydrolase family 3 C-terminal domain-containing protein [Caulobacter sp. CCNWLY153]|uniref:beta-glucosidase n=1 Tax=unclassified Caulobacter TaxID=2648921 RepID=UPI002FF12046